MSYLKAEPEFFDPRTARYNYSVWLRHLATAGNAGLPTDPAVVVELGPGHSLGAGLSAMISGADVYYGLDATPAAKPQTNRRMFEDILELFAERSAIPHNEDFVLLDAPDMSWETRSKVLPELENYEFPAEILTVGRMERTLNPGRIEAIRRALEIDAPAAETRVKISYHAPWDEANPSIIPDESVDMVFSQGALQWISYLPRLYSTLWRWLKPGGFMSHQVVFDSLGYAAEWNGHWSYSKTMWRIVKGKRRFILNRAPHSTYINLLAPHGFELVQDLTYQSLSGISRNQLAAEFRSMTDDDMATSACFFQARKTSENAVPDRRRRSARCDRREPPSVGSSWGRGFGGRTFFHDAAPGRDQDRLAASADGERYSWCRGEACLALSR
jgi:SAM-dependent methyltransferase